MTPLMVHSSISPLALHPFPQMSYSYPRGRQRIGDSSGVANVQIAERRPRSHFLVHHDNAAPHIVKIMESFLTSEEIEPVIVTHSTFYIYFYFPKIKNFWENRNAKRRRLRNPDWDLCWMRAEKNGKMKVVAPFYGQLGCSMQTGRLDRSITVVFYHRIQT
ncbi:hypothetical protein EVAR_40162_1 [Eumeta japonica]|uniref:Histone-lysine N-methyltransferase SETMAR n=1 Tax=Eumeta variegata TaxID=151549 RepID=A0A4C1YHP3_EUMVA|nr:hypothetical protein EVAR_40162_1 [Eumeta japonica]